jgi:hypothetical protein
MTACPSCGHESADTNKFCGECATPLGTSAHPVAEERKVVTSLFCDLIGFTATTESADSEDVGRMLSAYFAMARARSRPSAGWWRSSSGMRGSGLRGAGCSRG